MTLAAVHSKYMVLLLFIQCFLLLSLIVVFEGFCFIVQYLVSFSSFAIIHLAQREREKEGERERGLIYSICFLGVMYLFVFYVVFSSLVYIMRVAFPDHTHLLTTNTKQTYVRNNKKTNVRRLIYRYFGILKIASIHKP